MDIRRARCRQLRHDDGRYCGCTVLPPQDQITLPSVVMGDNTTVAPWMFAFAVVLLNVAMIRPLVTVTFDTYLPEIELALTSPASALSVGNSPRSVAYSHTADFAAVAKLKPSETCARIR